MSFLLLLMIVILLCGIVAGWVRAINPRRRRPALATNATCGMCGYSVYGLDKLTCPECGSNLRRVGIVGAAGAAREPIAFLAAAFFFSLVMLFVGWTVTVTMMDLLPQQRIYVKSITLQTPLGRKYVLSGTASAWSDDRPDMPVEVTILPVPGAASVLRFDNNVISYTAAGRQSRAAPTEEAVMAWMKSAGLDPSDPSVAWEARGLTATLPSAARIDYVAAAGSWGSNSSSSNSAAWPFSTIARVASGTVQSIPYAYLLPVATIAAVWLTGIIYLWRTYRRMRA